MKKVQLSENSSAFTFNTDDDFATNCYVIEKQNRLYVIDTHCGPISMAKVMAYYETNEKEVIVINTHFHWDHIWGNCFFDGCKIIAHTLCSERIRVKWNEQIENNRAYVEEGVSMSLPNVIFEDDYRFMEDGIRLFYTPGHTDDSISIFDEVESILYVGDNIELPLVYIQDVDVDRYIHTLEDYLKLESRIITASHTTWLSKENIQDTIAYLGRVKAGEIMTFQTKYENEINSKNIKVVHNNELQ